MRVNFFVLVQHSNPPFLALPCVFMSTTLDPLIQSFVLSALTKLSVKALPNPIPTSIMNVVRQQCQQHNTTTLLSSSLATIEVQQRAAEFLMIAELAVS